MLIKIGLELVDSKSNLKNSSKSIKNPKIVSLVNKSIETHTTYIYYFHKKKMEREMITMSINFMGKHA